MIRREGGKWVVRSHKTGRKMGSYDTKAAAKRRIRQLKRYSKQ